MKILILHSKSFTNLPSGEYIVAKNEYTNLLKRGINVHLFQLTSIFNYYIIPKYIRNILVSFFYIWSIESFIKTLYIFKIHKPSIIHLHGLFPFISTSVLFSAKLLNIPVLQTLHNVRWLCLEGGFYKDNKYCDLCLTKGYFHGVKLGCKHNVLLSYILYLARSFVWFRNNILLINYVDKFIAVSEFIKDQHINSGIPKYKITIKLNSINLPIIPSQNLKENRHGIVYFGRISKAKGSSTLKYLIKHIFTNFNIIGDGPEFFDLKDYCVSNNYNHVKFFGKLPQDECFKILSSSICSVVPSICGESFSLSAAESMALSTPVIAFNVGGLSSLISNSGGGILVKPNSHHEFFKATMELISNKSLAASKGKLGRDYVNCHLNPENNVQQLITIYNDIIKNRSIELC